MVIEIPTTNPGPEVLAVLSNPAEQARGAAGSLLEQEIGFRALTGLSTYLDPTGPRQGQFFSDVLEFTHSALLADDSGREWGYLTTHRFPRRVSDSAAVNNSTTLVNDDTLKVTLGANRSYAFWGVLFHTSGSTPSIKYAFTVPAGASIIWSGHGYRTSGFLLHAAYRAASGDAADFWTQGGAQIDSVFVMGTGTIGATQGDLQLQFAQNTADASDTKITSGSFLHVDLY